MSPKKSQVVGGSLVTALLIGAGVRMVLRIPESMEQDKQHDAEMKRQYKNIDREFRLMGQQLSSTTNPDATSQPSDERPQGEADGEEGGEPKAAPTSAPHIIIDLRKHGAE